MKVLIDIGHPAHVHLFKNVAMRLLITGHDVLFTCRDRDNINKLLEYYGFRYDSFGQHYKTLVSKALHLLLNYYKMLKVSIKYKPDMYLSNGSMFSALSAFLLRKPHIVHEDTGNWEQMVFYLPFSKYILTPESLKQDFGKKQYRYKGFQESFYLHRNHFKADPFVLHKYDMDDGTEYLVLRFVRYNASHDVRYKTLSPDQIYRLVRSLASRYKIFMSYEGGVPSEMEKYCKQFDPQDVHHVMAYSKGYIGQSATMASEAAHLGIPAVFIRSLNEKTEGVIDYQNLKGYIKTVDYSSHQVQDILNVFDEIAHKKLPDIHEEICDPTELLYSAIFNPQKYWKVKK